MKRHLAACRLLLMGLAAAATGAAAQAACEPDPARCGDLSADAEVTTCLQDLADEQDQGLNRNYRRIREWMRANVDAGAGSAAPSDAFKRSQEAWVTFRDLQCSAERGIAAGGSGGPQFEAACLCNVTLHRNQDFERMISSYGM